MTSKNVYAFLDRIEGEKAVLLIGEEGDQVLVLPVASLPEGSHEGSVFTLILHYEPELTADAADQVRQMIRRNKGFKKHGTRDER
jgi:hypothetical protein